MALWNASRRADSETSRAPYVGTRYHMQLRCSGRLRGITEVEQTLAAVLSRGFETFRAPSRREDAGDLRVAWKQLRAVWC